MFVAVAPFTSILFGKIQCSEMNGKEAASMAARMSTLRRSAVEAGEELSDRASQLLSAALGEARTRNLTTMALVAVSGFAVGLLAGILIAPASGYETRHRIGERASDAYKSAMSMAGRETEEMMEEAEKTA